MKRGFTLLELIIVVIIIGVLATLGFAQYARLIEGARGAEARDVIGSMRKMALAFWIKNDRDMTPPDPVVDLQDADVGIGSEGIPGADCEATHYFKYSISGLGDNTIMFHADRCGADGKVPQEPSGTEIANAVTLDVDFSTGKDNWASIAPY